MTKRILVVEDDSLLAMSLAFDLEDAGYTVVGPCASVAKALACIAAEPIDAAILDLNLGDETSEPIAAVLTTAKTPFIVVSGYDADAMVGAFQGATTLGKPYIPEDLIALLPQL
jgi:DNA-binding response OmpR family regulator